MAGVRCLAGGDTLLIGNGTYDEYLLDEIPSGCPGNPTTVQAENRRQAILQPSDFTQNNTTIVRIGRFHGNTSPVTHDIAIRGLVLSGAAIPARRRTNGFEVANEAPSNPDLPG